MLYFGNASVLSLFRSHTHTHTLSLPSSLPQTRVLVAESIRRNQEMSEMSHTDADSDAGLPDDSDELDNEIEVRESE